MNKTILLAFLIFSLFSCNKNETEKTSIAFHLDNNRLIIPAEIKALDGTMKNAKLWVDTGNPFFFISEELAKEIGLNIPPDSMIPSNGKYQIDPPELIQIGEFKLNFDSVPCYIVFRPKWLFTASHVDANIPSTVLMKYDLEIDYTNETLTIANPGKLKFSGKKATAFIHEETGIPQIDGIFQNDTVSFAIDIGASYCFGSTEFFEKIRVYFPDNQFVVGAVGCANIWGWLSYENISTVIRVPNAKFGDLTLEDFGITIPPDFDENGTGMMDYYSQKTYKPVNGFLGPNAFKDYKIGFDYLHQVIYFDKKRETPVYDLDLVPLTLKPEFDGSYTIIGTSKINNSPLVDSIVLGSSLLQINNFYTNGKPMGEVIDALRGNPGEVKKIFVKKDNKTMQLLLTVKRVI